MSSAHSPRPVQRQRPKYYDLNLAHLPPPGLVSIFHRITGVLLFVPVLPALLLMLDQSLGSREGYAAWRDFFASTPAKVLLVGVIWLYAHHFWAGIRYLLLDVHWGVEKQPARASANAVLVLGVLTALAVGALLW